MIALQALLALAALVLAWGFASLAWRGGLFTPSSRLAPGAADAAGEAGERPGGRRSPCLGPTPMRATQGRAGRPSFGGFPWLNIS